MVNFGYGPSRWGPKNGFQSLALDCMKGGETRRGSTNSIWERRDATRVVFGIRFTYPNEGLETGTNCSGPALKVFGDSIAFKQQIQVQGARIDLARDVPKLRLSSPYMLRDRFHALVTLRTWNRYVHNPPDILLNTLTLAIFRLTALFSFTLEYVVVQIPSSDL